MRENSPDELGSFGTEAIYSIFFIDTIVAN